MLLTIVADKYSINQRKEFAEAIDDICSPDDTWGWSSAGLYCYWDIDTREPLYIGLSVDLPRRFKQHNGLIKTRSGTKKEQIFQYFTEKEFMGFSLFLQSPLDQPDLKSKDRISMPGFEGEINIQRGEGTLLEAFRLSNSKYPSWNQIGGSEGGARVARREHYHYFSELTCSNEDSIFRSDYSIRELALDSLASECALETIIHGLRIMIIGFGVFRMPIERAVNKLSDYERQTLLSSTRGRAWVEKAKRLGY